MMTELQNYLHKTLTGILSTWNEADIYAISFFVYANPAYTYSGCSNVPEFHVSYNTESDCNRAGPMAEERWNYAFWRQDEIPIIVAEDDNDGMKLLFDLYRSKGMENIGSEDTSMRYDRHMRYIGNGPVGYRELLAEVTAVASALQESGFIRKRFGKPLPIIIHDLDYSWYVIEATKQANAHREADVFLAAMRKLGITE